MGPETTRVAGSDTLKAEASLSPRGALLRSAVAPGWGQWRHGKHLKALLFAGTVAGLASWAIAEQNDLRRMDDELNALRLQDPHSYRIPALQQRQQDQAARRNTRVLYVVLASTAAALDAYVDAHLAGIVSDSPFALYLGPDGAGLRVQTRW